MATGWTVRGSNPGGGEIFHICPDQAWGPPSLQDTMGTRSFAGVKSGRGVMLTPHPLLVPWPRKSRAIPLLPLWAIRPVQNLSACTRVHITFTYLNRLIPNVMHKFSRVYYHIKSLHCSPFATLWQVPKALVIFEYYLVTNSIPAVRYVGLQWNSASLKSEITSRAVVLSGFGRNRKQKDSQQDYNRVRQCFQLVNLKKSLHSSSNMSLALSP